MLEEVKNKIDERLEQCIRKSREFWLSPKKVSYYEELQLKFNKAKDIDRVMSVILEMHPSATKDYFLEVVDEAREHQSQSQIKP